MVSHPAGLATPSGALDLCPSGRYRGCSIRFFLVLLHWQQPRRNWLAAIMEVTWTFTASTRKLTLRTILQRAKGTMQDGPLTRTVRYDVPTRSTKEGIA